MNWRVGDETRASLNVTKLAAFTEIQPFFLNTHSPGYSKLLVNFQSSAYVNPVNRFPILLLFLRRSEFLEDLTLPFSQSAFNLIQ